MSTMSIAIPAGVMLAGCGFYALAYRIVGLPRSGRRLVGWTLAVVGALAAVGGYTVLLANGSRALTGSDGWAAAITVVGMAMPIGAVLIWEFRR